MEILGLFSVPLWAIFLLTVVGLYLFYSARHFGVFPSMGVKGPKPWLVLGNMGGKKGYVEKYEEWFRTYGRVFGVHEGSHPMLIVGDVDMLKDITVKEFSSFTNRRTFGRDEVAQPPITEILTVLKDDDWRHNRNTLSPTFSGVKLKKMAGMILDASRQMVDCLKSKADSREPFDAREHTGAYTMDVIASTAFGIQLDTQNNLDDPFIKYARKIFDISIFSPGLIILFFFPFLKPLMRWFNIPVFPPDSVEFFGNVVKKALVERRNNPDKYTDFLQLMINAETEAHNVADTEDGDANAIEMTNGDSQHWKDKRKGKGLTDSEILAASILFFTAGHETTASILAHLLYQLAMNPDHMDRLIAEVDQYFPDGKDPDYETVNKLPYLEMVLSEGLRINPPIARMDRICNKETTVRGLTIPVGMGVALPIYIIHHDPGYWPDPETFDPDRFTQEKRALHHPLQWIPFGYGPRNCIGKRLAMLELKIVVTKLLQKYRFVPNSKTRPLTFMKNPLLSRTKHGVWLTVEHRQ